MNGEEKQIGHTKDMIHDVGSQIRRISQFMTLEEGDLIFTGTPHGVGAVKPGDQIYASLSDHSTDETICMLDLSCVERQL